MNLNKDPESWARVSPEAVAAASTANIQNVVRMAIQDIQRMSAEIQRLRAFIWTLDGKTIAIRGEGDTFIDDGIVVASDHCPIT